LSKTPRYGDEFSSVALQNAVLCAECEVVSDSPHDSCLVCGSRSLFNIAHIFGGKLPKERVNSITRETVEVSPREVVLTFPKDHRTRRATASSRQSVVLDDNEAEEIGAQLGAKAR
jgi:hypothetical protein